MLALEQCMFFLISYNEGYTLSKLVLLLLIDVLKSVLMREWKVTSICLFVCCVLLCFCASYLEFSMPRTFFLYYLNKAPFSPLLMLSWCKDELEGSLAWMNCQLPVNRDAIYYVPFTLCRVSNAESLESLHGMDSWGLWIEENLGSYNNGLEFSSSLLTRGSQVTLQQNQWVETSSQSSESS